MITFLLILCLRLALLLFLLQKRHRNLRDKDCCVEIIIGLVINDTLVVKVRSNK